MNNSKTTNILLFILIILILGLGVWLITEKKEVVAPIQQEVKNTTTNIKEGTVATDGKKISREKYSFEAPKYWIVGNPLNFEGCLWDTISNDTSDGMRMAGEIGIYPKSCTDLSKINGKKEVTEKNGYYIIAFYEKSSGTTAQEEAETKLAYQRVVATFTLK